MPSTKSMTKVKKTVKSIKRFIKALTRTKSRASKKERKEAKKLRKIDEQRTLIQEESVLSVASSTSRGSLTKVNGSTSSRRGESSGSYVNYAPVWDCSLGIPRPLAKAQVEIDNFISSMLSGKLDTGSSTEIPDYGYSDPFVGNDESNEIEMPANDDWAFFNNHQAETQTVDLEILEVDEPVNPLPIEEDTVFEQDVQMEVLSIEENTLPSAEIPVIIISPAEDEPICNVLPLEVVPIFVQEDILPICEQPLVVVIEDDKPVITDVTVEAASDSKVDLPTEAPATSEVDLPTEVPVTSEVDLPTEVPVTSEVDLPTEVPATSEVDLPTEVPATNTEVTTELSAISSASKVEPPTVDIPPTEVTMSKDEPVFLNLPSSSLCLLFERVDIYTKMVTESETTAEGASEVSFNGLQEPALCAITSRCSYNPLYELTDNVFASKISSQKILLESCTPNNAGDSLIAYVRVANLSYTKNVYAHVSTDSWKKVTDIPATYVSSDGSNSTDQFMFELPSDADEFALCFEADGQSFWDNNNGRNYAVMH